MGRNNADFHGYDIVHKKTRDRDVLRTLALHRTTGKEIGELKWDNDPEVAPYVLSMYVHQDFRRMGVMSALLVAARHHAGQPLDVPETVSNEGEIFTKKAVKRGLLEAPRYKTTMNGDTGEEVKFRD
jgi:GNAT superfamily N-acetyltransferase